MGVQNPISTNISLLKNLSTKVLDSEYVIPNPDNSWRISSEYRLNHIQSMSLIHPRPESGTYASWRWADTNMDHEIKISWVGNDAPYRVSIVSAPVGSSIGGVQTQVFARTAIAGTDLYRHDLPESFAVFKFPKENMSEGQTYSARVLVESQSESLVVNLVFTVDNTKSLWFAPTGNNTNAGTFSGPLQTFSYGYNLANNNQKICRYKAGTYIINNGTANIDANFSSTCKSHIGYEPGVVFNLNTGHFSGSGDDVTFSNIKITGGRPDVGNVRQFWFNGRVRRAIWHKVEFETNVIGTTGTDNPAGVFFENIDPNYHEYISFSDCTLSPGSKTQMFVCFSVRKMSAFNCHALDLDNNTFHNGAKAFHLKHAFQDCTIQFCSASGRTEGGLIWVSSQNPTLCNNIDVSFSSLSYASTNTLFNAMQLNGQVLEGMPNANNLYIQRMSFIAGQSVSSGSSIAAQQQGLAVNPAKISACAWQSAGNIFIINNGYEFTGNASEKVSDVNNLDNNKKGLIGHTIYSKMVV